MKRFSRRTTRIESSRSKLSEAFRFRWCRVRTGVPDHNSRMFLLVPSLSAKLCRWYGNRDAPDGCPRGWARPPSPEGDMWNAAAAQCAGWRSTAHYRKRGFASTWIDFFRAFPSA
eukprot:scaffold8108_cov267-Pinguiococcus_pyrenoidosus.AAC.4